MAWPAPMGRVIDVVGLTGIGAGDGEILLQIADDYAPWNTGLFRFTGRDGRLTVEARVPRAEATAALAEAIERLGPFGKGNPEPLLALEAVTPRDLRPLGKAGKHLRFSAGGLDAVWWSGDRFARDLQGPVELVGRLGFNSWRGRRTLRFTVEDARPA